MRVLETRAGAGRIGFSGDTPAAGRIVEIATQAPGGVDAVVLNITAVDPASAGYLTAWPCGEPQPMASNLNFAKGQTIANTVISKPGSLGKVCVFTSASTDLLADLAGWIPAG